MANNPSLDQPGRRPRSSTARFVAFVVVVVLLLTFGRSLLQAYTDWLWFAQDARHPEVFTKTLRTQALLWSIGLLAAFFFIYLNALRSLSFQSVFDSAPTDDNSRAAANVLSALQRFAKLLCLVAALVVSLGVAATLGGAYRQLWAFQAAVPFGKTDPLFHKDIGFYVFKLPFYDTLCNVLLSVCVVTLAIVLLGYLGTRGLAKVAKVHLSQGPMRNHVSLLAAFTLLVVAWRMVLARYMLGLAQGPQFTGPGYAQSRVVAFYFVMAAATALLAVVTLVNMKAGRPWRALVFGVPVLLLMWVVLFGFVPGYIQQFTVASNSLTLEPPFARRAIEATRFAYGLDKFLVRDFAVKPEPTPEEVLAAQASLKSMRLWDPTVIQRVYDERQSMRSYYRFFDVDVDRYTVGSLQRMVMLSPRDVYNVGLDRKYQSWQNQHLRYTHGFGVVVTPANESVNSGQPAYWLSNFPPEQGDLFPLDEQRIYFAHYPEGSLEHDSYALLKTNLKEFDYPGETEQLHTWTGTRGVHIGGALTKFAYATLFSEIKLYTSRDITQGTRLVYHRDITDRASRIYPFLTFDQDPYVVVAERRLFWILDAYTVSDMVPYSDYTNEINYVRNSVKIVVDAYTGDMAAYAVEPDEPVLRTWMSVFPGLVRPASEIPAWTKAHFRYPEDLFAAQSEVMAQYHVTDPVKFLSNEDAWQIPLEIGADGAKKQIEPYYVQMRIPGATKDGFMLIRPFSPNTKNNMIGWMAAHCDPDEYGQVLVYRFPRDTQTQGPLQMEAGFAADPIVADINRQFNNEQSTIVPGNLLVIPIGSSLLYVKPLFLESKSRPIPELRKVILGLQNKVVVGDTYEQALAMLFSNQPRGAIETGEIDGQRPSQPAPQDLKQQLAEVARLLDEADAALRSGDFARYGELQRQAREKLRSLAK